MKCFSAFRNFIQIFPRWKSNIGLLRSEMPQIPKEHYDDFISYVRTFGFDTFIDKINPLEIIPTQSEISEEKVQKIINEIRDNVQTVIEDERFICASCRDGYYLLDGHHRIAALNAITQEKTEMFLVNVMAVNTTIQELVFLGNGFDKSFMKNIHERKQNVNQ